MRNYFKLLDINVRCSYFRGMKKHDGNMRQLPTPFLTICLAILPLLALSCSMEPPRASSAESSHITQQPILIQRAWGGSLSSSKASLFIYNNTQGNRSLDAFYSLDISGGQAVFTSTKGPKKAVMTCNIPESSFLYENIASYDAMTGTYASFMNENPDNPVLAGELSYDTGDTKNTMILHPLLCKIEIMFFETDFSGEPYGSMSLGNPRAYLINFAGFCPVLENGRAPHEIMSDGEFDYFTASRLAHMEMVYSDKVQGTVLYCYPGEETRLVIEGTIDGHTYFYPVPLNRLEKMRSGTRYALDILIRRKGTLDPSTDADSGMITCRVIKKPWEEKEQRDEVF